MLSQSFAFISMLLAIAATSYVDNLPECGPNEETTNCTDVYCGSQCSELGGSYSCGAIICSNTTIGCVCKEGYLRAGSSTSACVPISECSCYNNTNEIKCGPHQVPTDNYTACGTLCSQQGQIIECPLETSGIRGCDCEPGYARATTETSICVPKPDCPKYNPSVNNFSECGPNEQPTDCTDSDCGVLCSEMGESFSCPAGRCSNTTLACECKEGYLRAGTPTSACVPESECYRYNNTNTNKCGPHQVPTDNYNACGTLCSQQGHQINCPLETGGTRGCDCEPGYARLTTATSICVPISECPNYNCSANNLSECGPNEQPTNCSNEACGTQCSDVGEIFACPAITCSNTTQGCICQEGYYRAGSPTSACVPESECSCYNNTNEIKCGPHQVPTDNYTACGTLCSQQGQIIECPLETSGTKGCDCEPGYARLTTATSICVPISECPKYNCSANNLPECGPNEQPTNCTNEDCGTQCSDVGKIFHCPLQTCSNTTQGCICKEGYHRAGSPTSACVPESECCRYNNTNAIKCGPNQEPTDDYTACGSLCSQVGLQINCPLQATNGTRGCRCKDGYARATTATSICIPDSECPKYNCSIESTGCGPNEVSARAPPCITACPATCAEPGPNVCPEEICIETGCVCEEGYVRSTSANSPCILKSQCPKQ